MFDNRNLLIELKWQREYFKRGYISNQEELFNLWIFDECIKVLEQEPRKGYLSIDDVMSVFDDFMCGEVDEEGTEIFLEMLKDKAESEDV